MPSDAARPGSANESEVRPTPAGSVAILLCTYNGARFLPQQLASYEAQDLTDWRLFVSDDGSQDDTLALLEQFRNKHGAARVAIRRGPCKGFVANFLSLICDPAIAAEYYALSDQDDMWDANKLSRARQFIDRTPAGGPVVYCARTRLVDSEGAEIGFSTHYKREPHFRNALAQSLAGGNTMVINEQTRRLLMRAGADVQVASHDWWIYMLITAVGGQIIYDSKPTVSYRLHDRNLIGSNDSAVAKVARARMLWRGRYKSWTDMNLAALMRIENMMTVDNKRTFDVFRQSRKLGALPRIGGLVRSGIYRQSLLDDFGLLVAALARKI